MTEKLRSSLREISHDFFSVTYENIPEEPKTVLLSSSWNMLYFTGDPPHSNNHSTFNHILYRGEIFSYSILCFSHSLLFSYLFIGSLSFLVYLYHGLFNVLFFLLNFFSNFPFSLSTSTSFFDINWDKKEKNREFLSIFLHLSYTPMKPSKNQKL